MNNSKLQGQYPLNGKIPGNYQPCWIPHPQGGNSPFNSIPQWNAKTHWNNQFFWGPPFQGGNPPWSIIQTPSQCTYQVPPMYQLFMTTPII